MVQGIHSNQKVEHVGHKLRASGTLRRLSRAWPGEMLLAGGALRDRLMGTPTHDLDLVVRHDASGCANALASALNGKAFPLGRAPLITWRVVARKLQVDVWEITGSLEQDARRRDFTINALLWQLPSGPLIDVVGGLQDVAARLLRAVSEPNLFADPLRVLRAIRLLSTHPELSLDRATGPQLSRASSGLARVARERTIEELRLTLNGRGVSRALMTAARLGVLAPILPDWADLPVPERIAELAGRLAALAGGRGQLATGARDVALAVVIAPAAGFPSAWDDDRATAQLIALGAGKRLARRVSAAAALGERLHGRMDKPGRELRAIAAETEDDLAPALAWALARRPSPTADLPLARRLLRWHRELDDSPLLSGDELADLLELPADPRRGETIRKLRIARARGLVRTRAEAIRWLLSGTSR